MVLGRKVLFIHEVWGQLWPISKVTVTGCMVPGPRDLILRRNQDGEQVMVKDILSLPFAGGQLTTKFGCLPACELRRLRRCGTTGGGK